MDSRPPRAADQPRPTTPPPSPANPTRQEPAGKAPARSEPESARRGCGGPVQAQIQRVAQGPPPRVVAQGVAQAVRRVGEAHLRLGVREAERAARARVAEGAR